MRWDPSDIVQGLFPYSFPTGREQQMAPSQEGDPDQLQVVAWTPMVHGEELPEQTSEWVPFMEGPREKELVAHRLWHRKTEQLGTTRRNLRREALNQSSWA